MQSRNASAVLKIPPVNQALEALAEEKKLAKRGRPRNEAAKAAILATAYDLVTAQGMAKVTVDDIAATAGVGKQTIYRWWPSKAELVLDALEERAKTRLDVLETSSVSVFLTEVCAHADLVRLALKSLMAAAQSDNRLCQELLARLIEPRRATLRRCLEHAGVPKVRREALVLGIYGAMWCRLLLDEPLDETWIVEMARLTA